MKKIIAVVLMLALSLTMCISVSAEEITPVDKVAYLISKGIPEDLLNNFPPTHIDELYDTFTTESAEYLGTETVTMQDTGDAEMYGIIPSSDMRFHISYTLTRENDSLLNTDPVDHIKVFVTYDWEPGHPLVHWEDAITVNWDQSILSYDPDSFEAYDIHRIMGQEVYRKDYKAPAFREGGGLGYTANLFSAIGAAANNQQWLATCYGTATFRLIPAHKPLYIDHPAYARFPNNTTINANYVHNKNPLGGTTVGFSIEGVQVVANLGFLTDSVGTSVKVNYK